MSQPNLEPRLAVICGRCELVFYSLADYSEHVCGLEEEPQSKLMGNVIPWPTKAAKNA